MPDEFNPIRFLTEIGGVFKFGSGVLGKSAIAVGILLIGVLIALWRLHSDTAIIVTLMIGAVFFFVWFFAVLRFASKHPDLAMLDGAEWTGWKRFETSAKSGIPNAAEEKRIVSSSEAIVLEDTTNKELGE